MGLFEHAVRRGGEWFVREYADDVLLPLRESAELVGLLQVCGL